MNVNKTNEVPAKQIAKKETSLVDWVKSKSDLLVEALPKGTLEKDRFMQSAVLALTNPKNAALLKCEPLSVYRSLKEAASYGLELNGTLGQAYLIPYNEHNVMTCHFQMGYKGLIALARRSNTIKTIAAEPVYENDVFEVQLGVGRTISHKMDLTKERGEIIAYYCLIELTNGGIQFCVKSKKDIEKHRDKFSKAYKKDDASNIWNKNFDAMALKTCVIQALKLCPISIDALEAVEKEELRDSGEKVESNNIIATEKDYSVVEDVETVENLASDAKNDTVEQSSIENKATMSPDEEKAVENAFTQQQMQFEGDIF